MLLKYKTSSGIKSEYYKLHLDPDVCFVDWTVSSCKEVLSSDAHIHLNLNTPAQSACSQQTGI